jgi:ABC-2 type transport system ATP-binding protein
MIQATKLNRTFPHVVAVRDLTLSIARGEMFALIGPDGAGKTTFFRMVAGVLSHGHPSVEDVRPGPAALRSLPGPVGRREPHPARAAL